MKKKVLLLSICTAVILSMSSCALLRTPTINVYESLDNYKYVYITSTSELVSGRGIYGASSTKSINPSDVISGFLIKQGYIRLSELNPQLLDKTLIVNYGESGRRNLNLGYSIEVTIQFLSAKTNKPVCVCTAEGQGDTEADDIRIAINRALTALFKFN